MKRFAVFALFLVLLVALSACHSTPPQADQSSTIHADSPWEKLALPKISAAAVTLPQSISSPRFSSETLPPTPQPNDETCTLYVTPNIPATITNAEGQVLELQQGTTGGTMEVLGTSMIISNQPLHTYQVNTSESFTYIRQDGSSDYTEFTVCGEALFGGAYGTGIGAVHVSPQGIRIDGSEMEVTAYTASGCPDEYYFSSVISGESHFDLLSPSENGGASATTTEGTATVSIISNKTAMAVAEFTVDPAQTQVLFNSWGDALDGSHAPTEPTMTPEEMEQAKESAVWLYLDPNVPATIHNAEMQSLQIDRGELSGDMVVLDYKPEVAHNGNSQLCAVLVVNSERFNYSRQGDALGNACFMAEGPTLYAGTYGNGLGLVTVSSQGVGVVGKEMDITAYTSSGCPEDFYLKANVSGESVFHLSSATDGAVSAQTDEGQATVYVRSEKLLLPVAKFEVAPKQIQVLFSAWDDILSAAVRQKWISFTVLLVVVVLLISLVLLLIFRRKKAAQAKQNIATADEPSEN